MCAYVYEVATSSIISSSIYYDWCSMTRVSNRVPGVTAVSHSEEFNIQKVSARSVQCKYAWYELLL